MKTLSLNTFNKKVNDALSVEIFFNMSRPGTFMTLRTPGGLEDFYIGQDESGENVVEAL